MGEMEGIENKNNFQNHFAFRQLLLFLKNSYFKCFECPVDCKCYDNLQI